MCFFDFFLKNYSKRFHILKLIFMQKKFLKEIYKFNRIIHVEDSFYFKEGFLCKSLTKKFLPIF